MRFVLENNSCELPFYYTNGERVMVQMSVAAGNTRYIRVFDLPPEVTDAELSAVLGVYGTVKRVVRERFPADSGLNMFSGVRGLYVDIKKEIPEALIFCGRKGRIYFDGMKPKCYLCKSETHLKKACPNKRAQQSEVVHKRRGEQQPAPATKIKSINDGDAGMDGEVTTGAANVGTRKRQNKGEKIAKRTDKRQLSTHSSDSNNQPQEKKKTETVYEGDDDGDSIITVDDDMQSNRSYIGEPEAEQESESESDLEVLDFQAATTEAIKAWNDKRERMSRRQAKKIERLLSKHK
ncbi:uncharacterized protein LOC134286364 [Aedes albopictus]|uniref:CCHC-type domain-containing protein n=1 Tax=Aedes albopictus TaxID=7160 RepID=A0ABM1XSC2_AEDAL